MLNLKYFKKGLFFFVFLTIKIIYGSQEIATPQYIFPTIEVSATSLSELLAQYLFSSQKLENSDIKKLPVHHAAGVLEYTPGVMTQSRGNSHVQTDLSLRGASFEQVTVYVDGIPVNDPQTGHHHVDIPIFVSEIEHVEVLTGPSAAVLGSSNIGGVVHINTKKVHGNQTALSLVHGKYNTTHLYAGQAFETGIINHKILCQFDISDGYRYDSDYANQSYAYSNHISLQNHELKGFIGYSKKKFGANDFYANYPSYEKTQSVLGYLTGRFTLSEKIQTRASVYRRWHDDDFTLDFENPATYRAKHATYTQGFNCQNYIQLSDKTIIAAGGEIREEKIRSQQLGNHTNQILSFLGEIIYHIHPRWIAHGGIKSVHTNKHGRMFNPTMQLGFHLNQSLILRISSGKVFRMPTFTEKYYHSPANLGDPELKAETGWVHDFGMAIHTSGFKLEPILFLRHEKNRIEWIRSRPNEPWMAQNFNVSSAYGYELHFSSDQYPVHFRCALTGLFHENSNDSKYETKYPFNALQYQFYTALSWKLPLSIYHHIFVRANKYKGRDFYTLVDMRFSRSLDNWKLFLEFKNILNTQYEEINGLPMPGFGWMSGFQFQLNH